MWTLFLGGSGVLVMAWFTGGYEKYPDLLVLLSFIYFAVASPALMPSAYERQRKDLEKQRVNAVNADNRPEAAKIEERMEKLESYNTPLTLGHLNTAHAELNNRFDVMWEKLSMIERRLNGENDNDDDDLVKNKF